MRAFTFTLTVVAATLCACAVSSGLVREQAARDLGCAEAEITIYAAKQGRFSVGGCHAFAEYRCATNALGRTQCMREYLPAAVPPQQRAAQVRHKAASLLACAALQVRERPDGRYDVEGCGRTVMYECVTRDDCCAFMRPGPQPIADAADSHPIPPRPTTEAKGTLSKKGIKEVITAAIGQVRACYEAELSDERAIAGVVDSKFVIAPDGSVEASAISRSSLDHPGVEACIAEAVSKLRFEKPDGGGIVVVTYPFVLTSLDARPFAPCR